MLIEAGLQFDTSAYRPHALTPLSVEERHSATGTSYSGAGRLIQVPTVPHRVRPARPASEAARSRLRAHGAPHARGTKRRRLRREIRIGGGILLTLAPLALAIVLLSGTSRPTSAQPDALSSAVRPPAISISFDATVRAEPQSTVDLPGYLLPDEGAEEPVHAGR